MGHRGWDCQRIWALGEDWANAVPSTSSGLFSLAWQLGLALLLGLLLPWRVSWLVGWLTGVVCAEFPSKEGEEMPATPYFTLSTCQGGGEMLLRREQLLLVPLYLGLNKSPKQQGLVNRSVANHANGSAIIWSV